MATKKPTQSPDDGGWNSPQQPPDPNAPPTELDQLDFSQQQPPDPSTEDTGEGISFPDPAPPRPFPRPDFTPPQRATSGQPETILFGQPPAAPPPGPESAVPPPASFRSETQMLLDIMSHMVRGQLPLPSTASLTFDQCAEQLLSVFSTSQLSAIRNAALAHTQGSLAQWILALVNIHLDRGTLGEVAYNPDWSRQMQSAQQVGAQLYTPPAVSKCEYCDHDFRPPPGGNVRQRFCCDVCGKKAAGYGDEPIPHAPNCTTQAAKVIHEALAAATPPQKAA